MSKKFRQKKQVRQASILRCKWLFGETQTIRTHRLAAKGTKRLDKSDYGKDTSHSDQCMDGLKQHLYMIYPTTQVKY